MDPKLVTKPNIHVVGFGSKNAVDKNQEVGKVNELDSKGVPNAKI